MLATEGGSIFTNFGEAPRTPAVGIPYSRGEAPGWGRPPPRIFEDSKGCEGAEFSFLRSHGYQRDGHIPSEHKRPFEVPKAGHGLLPEGWQFPDQHTRGSQGEPMDIDAGSGERGKSSRGKELDLEGETARRYNLQYTNRACTDCIDEEQASRYIDSDYGSFCPRGSRMGQDEAADHSRRVGAWKDESSQTTDTGGALLFSCGCVEIVLNGCTHRRHIGRFGVRSSSEDDSDTYMRL